MHIRIPAFVFAVLLVVCAAPRPARADATLFLGATATPSSRPVRGVAVGVSVVVVGFEFEYSNTKEEAAMLAPSLRTGMANLLVQTPAGLSGLQFYGTVGTGAYRERLGTTQETNIGLNTGGGVKVGLIGPLRARVDYRVFTLRGSPLHSRVHRIYAGANVMF
jgi:hypothetical protein